VATATRGGRFGEYNYRCACIAQGLGAVLEGADGAKQRASTTAADEMVRAEPDLALTSGRSWTPPNVLGLIPIPWVEPADTLELFPSAGRAIAGLRGWRRAHRGVRGRLVYVLLG
jgi:hypothetical protein